MISEMQIIQAVNQKAEVFYNDATKLGDHAANVIGPSRRSQMTNLERIVDSTLKTTDVYDYIKKQTARLKEWQRPFERPGESPTMFGERLRAYLEENLKVDCDNICRDLGIRGEKDEGQTDEEQRRRRHIHLLLMRQFIHQVVAHYEFRVKFKEESAASRGGARHA